MMVCVALVLGAGGAASAGERTGSGKDTKWGEGGQTPVSVTAKSECAFSGLEDHDFESDVVPGEVQNWGAIVSGAGGHLGGAGPIGCNAHTFPAK
jgi:hypothetical protein